MKSTEKTKIFGVNLIWILPLAFLAGMTNGVLGAGGGIILVFMLAHLLKNREDGQKEAFALSCVAVLAFSTISTISYTSKGTVAFSDAAPYLIPALIGGLTGALILRRINTVWLKKIFAVLLIYGGIRMIL